jgi:uncharacterized protein YaaQ
MTLDSVAKFTQVQASAGYGSSATAITLQSGQGSKLPAAPFNLIWWNSTDYPNPANDPNVEIVRVTNVSTDTLTIARGQEGTSAANHNTGGKTYSLVLGITAKMITDLASQTETACPLRTKSSVVRERLGRSIASYKSTRSTGRIKVQQMALTKASPEVKALFTFYANAVKESDRVERELQELGFRATKDYSTGGYSLALHYSTNPKPLSDYDAETERVEKSLAGLKRSYTLKLFAGDGEAKELPRRR